VSITCLHYPAPAGAARTLLIMLPGAGINAPDFAANGMVAAAHEAAPHIDITVAAPDIALYLEDGVTELLHREIVAPALARGITRIWLLGISLGGMGALLYAREYQQHIEGLFLLAPFLGTKGTVAELTRAGGLPHWSPVGSKATNPEQNFLSWLQCHLTAPPLYLGYAEQDRFSPAHIMLAACLPPARVVHVQGGHDWPSWRALWHRLLALSPFPGRVEAR
jgi:pimeloyl-ACP methyl ester carboxylesterase